MAKIMWSQTAVRDMAQLEKGIARRIIAKIEAAAQNPNHFFEKLTGIDEVKLRVGDYRVIAQLLRGGEAIIIERVGHRKKIYKGLD
ncbi:MAG: type II toxin-antitoxin system RelE/ParE family toxin [Candidatus Micrarchaeota archaeon]